MHKISLISLDVGEKRIGVAVGDNVVKIAVPLETVEVDGDELNSIKKIINDENAKVVVIGYPRNQSGEPTAQTKFVKDFADKLADFGLQIIFQDESLTSVMAEEQLKSFDKPYLKADIDARAAAIILQDYIEANYA